MYKNAIAMRRDIWIIYNGGRHHGEPDGKYKPRVSAAVVVLGARFHIPFMSGSHARYFMCFVSNNSETRL